MSTRRETRRAAKSNAATANKRLLTLLNTSSDDDDNSTALDLMSMLMTLQKTSKKVRQSRTPKKKQSTISKKKVKSRPKPSKQSMESVSTVCLDSDEETFNNKIGDSHLKNIESKVHDFFKSGNLISDDEEDINLNLKENVSEDSKKPKDFYTILSDSEDEENSKKQTKNNDSIHLPSTSGMHKNSKENLSLCSNENQLMDIVDTILESNDEAQKPSLQDQSWEEYKKKTEDMLGSVSALIDEFKTTNEKENKKVDENTCPVSEKPSCPICLEVFGGATISMATFCGHMFCKTCITHVAQTTKKCPTCRKNINLKKIHPVYL